MINYAYIYSKQLKIPLLSKPGTPHNLFFNNRVLQMDLLEERVWAFYIYAKPLSEVSEKLRGIFKKGVLAEHDILEFCEVFKRQHTPEPFKYRLVDTPCITQNDDEYLLLGDAYLRDAIRLSHKHEQIALDLLSGKRSLEKKPKGRLSKQPDAFMRQYGIGITALAKVFDQYCEDFQIELYYKNNKADLSMLLTDLFLEQHGLTQDDISLDFKMWKKVFFQWKKIFKTYFFFVIPFNIIIIAFFYFNTGYTVLAKDILEILTLLFVPELIACMLILIAYKYPSRY